MNILVIDAMPLFLEGVTHALSGVAPNMVVRCATNLEQAWALAANELPDIVLLDYDLAAPPCAATLNEVSDKLPGVPTLVMIGDDVGQAAFTALSHGAAGLLPRTSTAQAFSDAIRQVLGGSIYLPRMAAQRRCSERRQAAQESAAELRNVALKLTPRQLEILQLLAQGKSNKQICRSIGAAEGTVKNHLYTIFRILGVHNRTEAAIFLA